MLKLEDALSLVDIKPSDIMHHDHRLGHIVIITNAGQKFWFDGVTVKQTSGIPVRIFEKEEELGAEATEEAEVTDEGNEGRTQIEESSEVAAKGKAGRPKNKRANGGK